MPLYIPYSQFRLMSGCSTSPQFLSSRAIGGGPLGDTKRGMKISNVLGMKWRGRRSGGGASAVTLLSLQKRAAPRNWCVGRHLEWRVRLWCRKLREAALGCQRKSMQQFSYDPQSYSQNFDDGHFKEHLSPLAPL